MKNIKIEPIQSVVFKFVCMTSFVLYTVILNLYRVLYLNRTQISFFDSSHGIEPIQSVVFKSSKMFNMSIHPFIEPIQSVVFKY